MSVRIRLARVGKKNAPMFRIVATDRRKMTKSMGIENLGTYNPMTGAYIQFRVDRYEDWIKKGAIPTDSVKKLYGVFKKLDVKKQAQATAIPSEVAAQPVETAAQPQSSDVAE